MVHVAPSSLETGTGAGAGVDGGIEDIVATESLASGARTTFVIDAPLVGRPAASAGAPAATVIPRPRTAASARRGPGNATSSASPPTFGHLATRASAASDTANVPTMR